jgi:hypothetical protein
MKTASLKDSFSTALGYLVMLPVALLVLTTAYGLTQFTV